MGYGTWTKILHNILTVTARLQRIVNRFHRFVLPTTLTPLCYLCILVHDMLCSNETSHRTEGDKEEGTAACELIE